MRIFQRLCVLSIALGLCGCAGRNAAFAPSAHVLPNDRFGSNLQRSQFAAEEQWETPERNDWEPTVAADPSSHWVYQMTTPQNPNSLLFRASSDSGQTWNPARHICRRVHPLHFQYDPQVAVGHDATVHVICLDGFKPGVVYVRSQDHGQSWSVPIRLDNHRSYSDKPILAVSPSGHDVYVAYNDFYALYVSASHDGGVTWSRPILATQRHLWYYPYSGTVAPNGSIWFAIDGESGKNNGGAGAIGLVHSSDGGSTWTVTPLARTHEGAPCVEKNCYPDFFTGEEAVAADVNNALVFVYAQNDRKQGPNDLYVRRSVDGVRWSAPFALTAGSNATSPALVAGPTAGDFRLAWQDDRNGPHAWNTWFSRSADGGVSWSHDVRLSNLASGAPYKHSGGYDFPFGDYFGISVDSAGTDFVVWGEGSAVYAPGGTWFTKD